MSTSKCLFGYKFTISRYIIYQTVAIVNIFLDDEMKFERKKFISKKAVKVAGKCVSLYFRYSLFMFAVFLGCHAALALEEL